MIIKLKGRITKGNLRLRGVILGCKDERKCETCGVSITEGYCIDGGIEYYCNDHEPLWYRAVYEADPDGDTYWTQWD